MGALTIIRTHRDGSAGRACRHIADGVQWNLERKWWPFGDIGERAHTEVGDELVRGWAASQRRLAEPTLEIGQGNRSGHFPV